jgi:hypothetical protein
MKKVWEAVFSQKQLKMYWFHFEKIIYEAILLKKTLGIWLFYFRNCGSDFFCLTKSFVLAELLIDSAVIQLDFDVLCKACCFSLYIRYFYDEWCWRRYMIIDNFQLCFRRASSGNATWKQASFKWTFEQPITSHCT